MTNVKSICVFLLISATLYTADTGWFSVATLVHPMDKTTPGGKRGISDQRQDGGPTVAIAVVGAAEHLTWNTQVRYMISVSDPKDGDSRFGEIDARASLMEIEYFPAGDEREGKEAIKTKEEHKGLSLMARSTCFGCHADKTRLAGPSFAEIAQRYKNNAATVKELGSHILSGSTGIWGNQMMPAHPDLTLEQAAQIAEYILIQGGNKNRWIYSGLEGTFRTVEKTKNSEQGIYVLTASYTSTSNIRGEQSLLFKIK
jgi:cytochrome c